MYEYDVSERGIQELQIQKLSRDNGVLRVSVLLRSKQERRSSNTMRNASGCR
jgi:hypothetical protein